MLKFTFCVNKGGFYCVLYLYRPVQQNVHWRCEPEGETLVGVTCGEFLAIWIAGTFEGKIFSSSWNTHFFPILFLK